MKFEVLSTPGHLISLAARGFARLSEARLKPLGFGVGHLPVLVALQDGEFLATHWSIEDGQGKILAHRLRVQL